MRKFFVVLAAAIVFTPRPALTDSQASSAPLDSLPQTDFLPAPSSAPAASFASAPKPLVMLGLLAALSQWRLATSGAQPLTMSSAPLKNAAHGLLLMPHGKPEILPHVPHLCSYNACVKQPHRRAPPRAA